MITFINIFCTSPHFSTTLFTNQQPSSTPLRNAGLNPKHVSSLPSNIFQIAGPGMDCLINTLFFIAGVIPGHIHGFYISCTYFNRKKKVRKGRYPGGRKSLIYSEEVWNGGASNEEVRELRARERRRDEEKMVKRKSRRSSGRW